MLFQLYNLGGIIRCNSIDRRRLCRRLRAFSHIAQLPSEPPTTPRRPRAGALISAAAQFDCHSAADITAEGAVVRTCPFSQLPSQPNPAAKSAGSWAVDSNCNAADIAVDFAAEVGGEVGGVKELASRELAGHLCSY